ncbi:MAG: NAD(P)-dependent oxidoreductase [Burkholderiales bacterium]|nr:NAD(P)-dependent oxidoreductase [Burkholderiales bacterium]
MDRTVGIVGLGIMGGAMARNLMERGWRVVGFDTDPGAMAALAGPLFTGAENATGVAAGAPIIITSLPSSRAALAVAGEIAGSGAASRIVCETSTLSLADKERIGAVLTDAGHVALDCPLSGTGSQAAVRDLIVYASGPAEAIARCVPVFKDISKQHADVGAYGNGSKVKFIANHLVAINNVATAEAMVLAEKAGLDLQMVLDLVGPGAGGSRIFQIRGPLMVANDYAPPTMRIATWQKDMQIIAEFAQDLGSPTPLFDRSAPVYDEALKMGLGELDTAAVCKVFERDAGVKR